MIAHLMTEIANASADHAVDVHGRGLDKMARMKLWAQYHDAAIACLISYEELVQARRIRERVLVSEN